MSSYIDYYSLIKQPFSSAPNVDFYCNIPTQNGVAESILDSLNEGESCIKVTGPAGVGKTLLMKKIVASLDDSFHVCRIMSPDIDAAGLRSALADELGVNSYNISQLRLLHKVNDRLIQLLSSGKKTVLVIDEAQLLQNDAIEALRIITNLEHDSQKLLQLVVFAQPSLDERLYSKEFSQVLQRFNKSINLSTLNFQDLDLYLTHRLVSAGHPSGQLFTVSAKKRLFKLTNGVPLLVNVLSSKSLLIAYQRGLPYVDVNEVQSSIADCHEMLFSADSSNNSEISRSIIWSIFMCSLLVLGAIAYKMIMLGYN